MIKRCHEIHEEASGCQQNLPGSDGWQYCPACGRGMGHLSTPNGGLRLQQGISEYTVRLINSGLSPVQVRVKVETAITGGGVQLSSGQSDTFPIAANSVEPVRLQVDARAADLSTAFLLLHTNDAIRPPHSDPWNTVKERFQQVAIAVTKPVPSVVHALPTALLFAGNRSQRTVTLHCAGRDDRTINSIEVPSGYRVTPSATTVAAGQAVSFSVEVLAPPSGGIVPAITFRLDRDQTVRVPIYTGAPSRPTALPRAIIGVDFGTAYTSIAYRKCLNRENETDPVTFLSPPGSPDNIYRFRTRIWLGVDGSIRYGEEATRQFDKDPGKGFLAREIKTLLRDEMRLTEVVYPPQGNGEKELDYLRRRNKAMDSFGTTWESRATALVTEYLRWLYESIVIPHLEREFLGSNPLVRYVFSLPVLDSSLHRGKDVGEESQYEKQRRQMRQCIADAGFPIERTDFEFEPVCAALGLVMPPTEKSCEALTSTQWPRLGTQNRPLLSGAHIALFDSGGGTTDVVVMEAQNENGRIALDVVSCLGVDESEETFGGEAVTFEMLSRIAKPIDYKSPARFGSGADNRAITINDVFAEVKDRTVLSAPDGEKGIEERSVSLALRDAGESLKRDLAKVEADDFRVGTVVITPALLADSVEEPMGRFRIALQDKVFAQYPSRKIPYYLTVGGNTAVPAVEKQVQEIMNDSNPRSGKRFLNLPQTDRNLAVCYGTVMVPDARIRSEVAYGLRVFAKVDGGEETLLELSPNVANVRAGNEVSLNLPSGDYPVYVSSQFNALSIELATLHIKNQMPGETLIHLRGELVNKQVRVRFRYDKDAEDEWTTLWEYDV